MRVIECNRCGHVEQAATDEELAKRLFEHIEREHPGTDTTAEAVRKAVSVDAYEASDA